ncbi:unnamed protein product, partial [Mesorhabditis belari]|uniref:Uncharacterized protein n=1 Tax=Mesorhabditis belari TaxID=2138241 RepID=A0AAF3F4R6_9BILA
MRSTRVAPLKRTFEGEDAPISSRTRSRSRSKKRKNAPKESPLKPAIHDQDVALIDINANTLFELGLIHGVEQYSVGQMSTDSDDLSLDGWIHGHNKRLMIPEQPFCCNPGNSTFWGWMR